MIPPAEPSSPDDPEQVANAVKSLLDQAHEIATGATTLADAQTQFIAGAETVFAQVRGPGDFRWPLQLRIAEAVIYRGGFSSQELRTAAVVVADREAIDRGEWSNIGVTTTPQIAEPEPVQVSRDETPDEPAAAIIQPVPEVEHHVPPEPEPDPEPVSEPTPYATRAARKGNRMAAMRRQIGGETYDPLANFGPVVRDRRRM